MKFVANLLVAIHNVSAAEAFVLGMKAGLSPKTIFQVAGDGAGTSRMFQVRGPQMVRGRYRDATMKVEVWQKDMKIIGEFAAALGADAAVQRFGSALQRGHGARLREGRHRERLCGTGTHGRVAPAAAAPSARLVEGGGVDGGRAARRLRAPRRHLGRPLGGFLAWMVALRWAP